jgi:hypothetical protein
MGLWLTLLFNCCLIIDLIIMVRDPFSSKEKYMTIYWIASLSISFTLVTIMINFAAKNLRFDVWTGWIMCAVFSWLYVFGFFSIFYAYLKLSKPGISGTAR